MATPAEIKRLVEARLRDSQLGTIVYDAINWARRYVQRKHNWSFGGSKAYSVLTIAPDTVSDCTATNGSATVTVAENLSQVVTDTALSVWHYVTFATDTDRFYRIVAATYAAPTTTLTITPAFQGTTATDETATIYFREYPLPTDFVRMQRFVGEDGAILAPYSIDDLWYSNGEPTEDPAEPTKFSIRGENRAKVILNPIPDAAYALQMEYEIALSDVSASSTEADMIIPARWHDLIAELAVYHLRHEYKDDDRAPNNWRAADAMLQDMIREDLTEGGLYLPVVQSRDGVRGRMQRRRALGRW